MKERRAPYSNVLFLSTDALPLHPIPQDSRVPVPADLAALAAKHAASVAAGTARVRGSGYGGRGHKFDDGEEGVAQVRRRREAGILGLEAPSTDGVDVEGGAAGARAGNSNASDDMMALDRLKDPAALRATRAANAVKTYASAVAIAPPAENPVLLPVPPPVPVPTLSVAQTLSVEPPAASVAAVPTHSMTAAPRQKRSRFDKPATVPLGLPAGTPAAVPVPGPAVLAPAPPPPVVSRAPPPVPRGRAAAASVLAALDASIKDAVATGGRRVAVAGPAPPPGGAANTSGAAATGELEINDFVPRARSDVTKREALANICRETGCAVVVRGHHYPPGSGPTDAQIAANPTLRRLHLWFESTTDESVRAAKRLCKEIIEASTEKHLKREAEGGGGSRVA